MSLMKTLAKVAIGVAIAKGVGAMVQGAKGGSVAGRGSTYGGGSASGGSRTAGAAPGGLEDLMGQVLGGRAKPPGKASAPAGGATTDGGDPFGGLGGVLEQLAGGRSAG